MKKKTIEKKQKDIVIGKIDFDALTPEIKMLISDSILNDKKASKLVNVMMSKMFDDQVSENDRRPNSNESKKRDRD